MADERKAITAFLNVKRAQGLAAARAFNKQRSTNRPRDAERAASEYRSRPRDAERAASEYRSRPRDAERAASEYRSRPSYKPRKRPTDEV